MSNSVNEGELPMAVALKPINDLRNIDLAFLKDINCNYNYS